MGGWLDLLAVCVNEWTRRKWLEYDMSYNVYVHYNFIFFTYFCRYVKWGSGKKWIFLTISQGIDLYVGNCMSFLLSVVWKFNILHIT